jgi:hypothetical protein
MQKVKEKNKKISIESTTHQMSTKFALIIKIINLVPTIEITQPKIETIQKHRKLSNHLFPNMSNEIILPLQIRTNIIDKTKTLKK